MAIRVKSRWSDRDRARSAQDTASALAFNIWRIAADRLLNLENEGFQTDSRAQRMDVIAEFLAFMVHMADRLVHDRMSGEERGLLLNALGGRLADLVQDNTRDCMGPGEYRGPFIDRVNERSEDYAGFSCPDGEPGFGMLRLFGEKVTATLGPKDLKWVSTQVMDIEAPEAMRYLRRALGGLVK